MEIYFKAKWKWHTVNRGEKRRCAGAMNRTTPIRSVVNRRVCAQRDESEIAAYPRKLTTREGKRYIGTLIIKINASAENYWNSGVWEGRGSDWQTEDGREERKKWGNKPGKFIFPRGLPLEFRPSKNGTLNGNPHTMTYNYRAPIDEVELFGLRQTAQARHGENMKMSDNNWKLIWKFDFYWSPIWSLPLVGREAESLLIDGSLKCLPTEAGMESPARDNTHPTTMSCCDAETWRNWVLLHDMATWINHSDTCTTHLLLAVVLPPLNQRSRICTRSAFLENGTSGVTS